MRFGEKIRKILKKNYQMANFWSILNPKTTIYGIIRSHKLVSALMIITPIIIAVQPETPGSPIKSKLTNTTESENNVINSK